MTCIRLRAEFENRSPQVRRWRHAIGLICVSTGTAILAQTAFSPAQTPAGTVSAPHGIPFDFSTRQPIVPVRVNGGAPVPFVIDTGASIHLVDSGVARLAQVSNGTPREMRGGGQASVQAQIVEPLTLEAGGIVWNAQRAAVTNLDYPGGKHFAGLLGAPILMRYTVRFVFETRTVQLIDPSTYTPPAGAMLVPFELQEDLPIVHVTVDAGSGSIDARLMVDTGASQFADLNRPFVDAHRLLEVIPDVAPVDRPAAIGGSAPFLYGTARRIVLGGISFDRPRIGLSRASTGSSARADRDGIIGNALLERFVVTVDYRRRTLVLEPRPSIPKEALQSQPPPT
jgi:aspartyl protease